MVPHAQLANLSTIENTKLTGSLRQMFQHCVHLRLVRMQNMAGEVSVVNGDLERLTGPRHHPDRVPGRQFGHHSAGGRVKRSSVYQPRAAEYDIILHDRDVTVICIPPQVSTQEVCAVDSGSEYTFNRSLHKSVADLEFF